MASNHNFEYILDIIPKGKTPIDGHSLGKVYDSQSEQFSDFSETSYSWLFIERPAFDKYISDLYRPDTRVVEAVVVLDE